MVGLALSQYLWSTHYAMFSHLKETLEKNKTNIQCYLEVGPGHGLFLKEALTILGMQCDYTAVDISDTSLELTKSIISFFKLNDNKINYIKKRFCIPFRYKYSFSILNYMLYFFKYYYWSSPR